MAKVTLVFVCSANRVRSVMAAAIARKLVPQLPISSAGLSPSAGQGRKSPPRLRSFLARRGMNIEEHRSRRLTAEDANRNRLIVVMTTRQMNKVLQDFPNANVKLLADYEIFDDWKPLTHEKIKRMYALIYPAVVKLLATVRQR
jgi:protein-tyrosine phosphatase